MSLKDRIIESETKRQIIIDTEVATTVQNLKVAKNPVMNYDVIRSRNGDWERPEYDFSEIERFSDIEAYLAGSFRKKLTLFMKEGHDIVGKNPDLVEYVQTRLRQIAHVSKFTENQLIYSIAQDMIKFSNSFIVFVRNRDSSGGLPYIDSRTGKKVEPIAGLFVLPAATVEVKTNDQNQVVKYRQTLRPVQGDKLDREYPLDSIAHMWLNKKEGFVVGTPRCIPVLEDIKALRRLEENVELLTVQNIFPLIHYKVGTESRPATIGLNGESEINTVINQIEAMPPEGIFVTPERHEISMIGTEGRALRVENYLAYFKQRVISGLGLSTVDVGEGGMTKSTASTMSRSLIDEVKADQRVVEDLFNSLIINSLLMESGQNIDLSDEENLVKLQFREIDIDQKVLRENHCMQSFLQNAITHGELRAELGYNPMTDEEWDDSYFKKVTESLALLAAASSPSSPTTYTAANSQNSPVESGDISKATSVVEKQAKETAKAKATIKPASSKTVSNKTKPGNQHGTSSKRTTKDSISDSILDDLRHDIVFTSRDTGLYSLAHIVRSYESRLIEEALIKIQDSYRAGVLGAENNISLLSNESIVTGLHQQKQNVQKYISKFFNEIDEVKSSSSSMLSLLDSIGYRIDLILDTESTRAYNWGMVNALKLLGNLEYKIDIGTDSDPNELALVGKNFPSDRAYLHNIPPFHPNSSLRLYRA